MALTQITTDGIKDGTITGTDLTTNVDFVDNQKLRLGTGNDLEIFHASDVNTIIAINGALYLKGDASNVIGIQPRNGENSALFFPDGAVELYHNNSKKLQTTSDGAFITGNLEAKTSDASIIVHNQGHSRGGIVALNTQRLGFGSTHQNDDLVFGYSSGSSLSTTSFVERMRIDNGTGNVQIPADNAQLQIGADQDLQIYHNGTNSIISNTTGALKLLLNNDEDAVVAIQNAQVALYYDGSQKFETTSAGVSVSGNLVCGTVTLSGGGLALADNDKVVCGNGDDLQIYHDGSHNIINGATGQNLEIQTNAFRLRNQADSESMIVADADGAVELYHNNSRKLETQSYGVKFDQDTKHLDNGIAYFGTSGDLQIYHDGSKNYLKSAAFTNTEIWSDTFFVKSVTGAGEAIIKGSANGAVELYYDNSKKFETASFGVQFAEDVQFSSPGDNNALTWDKSEFTLEWRDNVKASWGDSKDLQIYHNGSESYILNTGSNLNLGTTSGNNTQIYGNNTVRWLFTYDGHFLPSANNSYDIGSTSLRVRNIYTNDLNLSNEGSSNDVDGTWGSYTIQEGAEDLFLVNKRNGKKYKFALTEVS